VNHPLQASKVPWQVWAAALSVALLRALPYWALRLTDPPPGRAFLQTGYIPKDWLSYAAFVRQAAQHAGVPVDNPFTTEVQSGRFILLYHQVLGALCSLTGLDPLLVLELSRIPLLLLFFWLLWRFLSRVFPQRDHRLWALWLAALSGGLEFLVEPTLGAWPSEVASVAREDFWPMFGWSTFQAAYNPLWLAGLCLVLPLLQSALDPETTRSRFVWSALGFFVLYFVHPYSAIAVLAIVVLHPVLMGLLAVPGARAAWLRSWPPLLVALGCAGCVSLWQLRDPVYRSCSGGLLGGRILSVFWYPLTYGVLLLLAVRGWQRMVSQRHPWRFGLGAWSLAILLLHSSPVLNGYHFLYFQHLPLALVAAPVLADLVAHLQARPLYGRMATGLLLVSLFIAPLVVTVQAIGEALREHKLPAENIAMAKRLAQEPPGNALTTAGLGNLVPAFSPHHVYVGHWFMTPRYEARKNEVDRLFSAEQLDAHHLQSLVRSQQLRYVVLPRRLAGQALRALAQWSPTEIPYETQSLVVLRTR